MRRHSDHHRGCRLAIWLPICLAVSLSGCGGETGCGSHLDCPDGWSCNRFGECVDRPPVDGDLDVAGEAEGEEGDPDLTDRSDRPDQSDQTEDPELPEQADEPDGDLPGDEELSDVSEESDQSDQPDGDLPPPPGCRRSDGCLDPDQCNLSSGRCERRAERPGTIAAIHSIYPLSAAPDDLIVVDGEGFWIGMLGMLQARLSVGGTTFGAASGGWVVDENRAVFRLPAGTAGPVTIVGGGTGAVAVSDEAVFADLQPGVQQACGPDDPAASGVPGVEAADPGPYAAGYTDVHQPDEMTRVYYPAVCGGLRRPPADGNFPFVMILHGDGAGHINYDFLGRHLASWGFIAACPPSTDGAVLVQVLDTGLNRPGSWFSPLAGRSAGGRALIVGHSKGTERTEYVLFDQNETRVAGVVFMGPVNRGERLSIPSLYFAASGDQQAFPWGVRTAWDAQPAPKWFVLIKGGNHSQFSDDKHWEGSIGDALPTMLRGRQFVLVQSFTLAFLQRMSGGQEPFAFWLSAPGLADEIEFAREE